MHNEINQDALELIIQEVIKQSLTSGADQVKVAVSHAIGFSVNARMSEVENIEYTNGHGLSLTVLMDKKKGSASTTDLNKSSLSETIKKACSFAKYTTKDECSGLPEKSDMFKGEIKDLELYHDWEISVEEATQIAIECEAAALNLDPKIVNSEGASVSSNRSIHVYGDSHNFLNSEMRTSHSIGCVVLAGDKNEKQRDYWSSSSRHPDDLDNHLLVGKKAGERTLDRLGSKKIDTTEAPVLFSPKLSSGFINHAVQALSGGAQYREASFLLGAMGNRIFPEFLSIKERPHLLKGWRSSFYDGEGVGTYDRNIVQQGVIEGYFLDSYSARRLKMETTGNCGGAHNLIIPGNISDQEAIISTMKRGLLVQELIGQGVNNVTGDYSRGVAGFWIEDGKIIHPVHEVTISGNLLDLYQKISLIGNDYDHRSSTHCGALLVDNMRIAGN